MHLSIALMRMGMKVGVLDLDVRQRSLSRYLENRARWIRNTGAQLSMPEMVRIDASQARDMDAAEAEASPERDRALYVLLRGRSLSPLPREAYSTHPNEVLMSRIGNPAVREEAAAWFDK
jgi:Mrp family chromosome partitioning ATPase